MKCPKSVLIHFIAMNIYSDEYKHSKRTVLSRVRNRIDRAIVDNKFLEDENGDIERSEFFLWASNLKGWTNLQDIIKPSSIINSIVSTSSSFNASSVSQAVTLPVGVELNKEQQQIFIKRELKLMDCRKKRSIVESELIKTKDENKELKIKKRERQNKGGKRY